MRVSIRSRWWRAAMLAAALSWPSTSPAWAQADDIYLRLDRTLTFVDGRDAVVKSTDFEGKWLLVYFGYMHCADLCPWGLTVLGAALDLLGPAVRHVQPLFVTVDPERDHGKALVEFTASFHGRLVGLTGTEPEIRAAADAMAVKFSKVAQGADYAVDHSSSYTLIAPDRRTVLTFRKAEAHMVAAKVVEVLERSGLQLEGVSGLRAGR